MNIVVGHTNMDLDCLGSMVLAKYLYPNYQPVRSRLVHPVAKALYNLYQNHFDFISSKELRGKIIEKILVLDTRSYSRVKEYFDYISTFHGEVEIIDHHSSDTSDIPNAIIQDGDTGANTTILGLEMIKRKMEISPVDATIALTGIYADTGNFTHENVTIHDFKVASWLIEHGASMKLVRKFLKSLKEEHQITLFHNMLNRLNYKNVHGHSVIFSYVALDTQVNGLAAVVEKVFEIENPDSMFAIFYLKKQKNVLIIARSQKESIPLNVLLKPWGGGGHTQAASAIVKKAEGPIVMRDLEAHLREELHPASSAGKIMTSNVCVVNENWTLLEASKYFEEVGHTGAPVVNAEGELTGFMTLRDIMKGRRVEQMHSPVKAYMSRKVITCGRNTPVRDIEKLLFRNNIGHLPVVEDEQVIGLVTRSDYLNYVEKRFKK